MDTLESVTREHVLATLAEHDSIGGDVFLTMHGFEPAEDYVLWHDGSRYDAKAIVDVSHSRANGSTDETPAFDGDNLAAAELLAELGFTIAYVGRHERPAGEGQVGGWVDATEIGPAAAREAWVEEARLALLETAKKYQAVITHKELAALVQARTGIKTRQMVSGWLGEVLRMVAEECEQEHEPLLNSLCVNAEGSVGDAYAVVVGALRGDTPPDGDAHAAIERLACHTYFGANLPEGGGLPQLTPRLMAARTRQRKAFKEERPPNVCPTCMMAIPATGVCDNCD